MCSAGVCTLPKTGKYRLAASGLFNSKAWTLNQYCGLKILKNTSTEVAENRVYFSGGTQEAALEVNTEDDFVKGDTVEVHTVCSITANAFSTAAWFNVFTISRIK
jgi:hypothetical protein